MTATNPRVEDASTILIQPEPLYTRVLHLPVARPTSTAVVRGWTEANARRCALCRHCTVIPGEWTCLVGVDRVITEAEAARLSDRDYQWSEVPRRAAGLARTS